MYTIGARRGHTYEIIRVDPQVMKSLQQDTGGLLATGGKATGAKSALGGSISGPVKSNKKDWEEFYDSSARAKYWFNKSTGEASWICPY